MPVKAIAPDEIVPIGHPINSKITTEWVNVTPDVAEKWLSKNHDNRNKRPTVIRTYARDMRNGKWRPTGEAIKFDYNGVLIDGQHRLEAVIESGVTVRFLVIKGLDPLVKQVLDTGAKRKSSDALRFAGYGSNATVTASVARIAMAREAGLMKTAFSSPPAVTNAETVEWVSEHEDAAGFVSLGLQTYRSIGILPSAWGYALYEMGKINPALTYEFALSMHEKRLDGIGDPRVTMLNAFTPGGRSDRRKPGIGETIFISFRTWNAWAKGERLAKLYTSVKGDPSKGAAIPALVSPTIAVRERYYA